MFSVIFPGQGSQIVGMGKEFFEKHNLVKELFQEADDVLGMTLSKIIASLLIDCNNKSLWNSDNHT